MGQHQEGSSVGSLASCQIEQPTAPQMWSQAWVPLCWRDTHVTLVQVNDLLRMWVSQPVSEWALRWHLSPSVLSHKGHHSSGSAAPFP